MLTPEQEADGMRFARAALRNGVIYGHPDTLAKIEPHVTDLGVRLVPHPAVAPGMVLTMAEPGYTIEISDYCLPDGSPL